MYFRPCLHKLSAKLYNWFLGIYNSNIDNLPVFPQKTLWIYHCLLKVYLQLRMGRTCNILFECNQILVWRKSMKMWNIKEKKERNPEQTITRFLTRYLLNYRIFYLNCFPGIGSLLDQLSSNGQTIWRYSFQRTWRKNRWKRLTLFFKTKEKQASLSGHLTTLE